MKKLAYLLLFVTLISCGGLSKIYNKGSIQQSNYQETIPFNYDNNFALIEVEINSKSYTFLVDTGAPTVISSAIYEDIKVKPASTTNVSDSQGNSRIQEVIIIPEIKIGNLTYQKIGAVVADLRNVFEFDCMGIDGIIGANQMAKSFWKFDYQNKEITITDQLSNYDVTSYKDSLNFYTSAQKTPYITGSANGKSTRFTFDTGSSGNIDVKKSVDDFKEAKSYTKVGTSGVGLYGAKDSVSTKTIQLDSLRLDNLEVGAQTVDLDHNSLIGNDFMNKHDMIIDWKNKYIYLNKLKEYQNKEDGTFGFGFRFINDKAMVTSLIEELPIDLEIGDEILAINDYNFENLDKSNVCDAYLDIELKKYDSIDVSYQRNNQSYRTQLKRVKLLK